MKPTWEQFAQGVMSGRDRRWRAAALRAALSCVEPFYASAMRVRNALYDRGWLKVHELGRPAISVGNLTAGGTGKTPMVVWLAQRLRQAGRRPAVLLRGYTRGGSDASDEAIMLDRLLNEHQSPPVRVEANPDRVQGAARVLVDDTSVDVFVLDDAFQHRRAARRFDVLLINAADPWGYGHVHPRGLLREPMTGLRRASAIVLTRAGSVEAQELSRLEQAIRALHPTVPIYHADHHHTAVRSADGEVMPLERLRTTRFYAFSGIGQPAALERQLAAFGASYAGGRWFADHHHYVAEDLEALQREAHQAGAQMLLTTEKDWAKIASLSVSGSLAIWRIQMEMRFRGDEGEAFFQQTLACVLR